MLVVAHTALGIASGLVFDNPVAAFGVGVVSHHLADATPHFDPGSYLLDRQWQPRTAREYELRDWIFVSIDLGLTVILLYLLLPFLPSDRWPAIISGMVGANLPDLVHNVPFWGPALRRFGWIAWWQDALHHKYQWTLHWRQWYWGVATQAVTIGLVVWLIFEKRQL